MVADLIRDSPFGHCVRFVTKGKVFQYPEEKDHNIWKKYVNEEKSGHAAHHGTTEAPEDRDNVDELNNARGISERENDSRTSSQTQVAQGYNEASGVRVDPEKGKDLHVIDWYGPDDAQVCVQDHLGCFGTG
jgi:DHA1 family multidrug resistance protein-like MFS transporter